MTLIIISQIPAATSSRPGGREIGLPTVSQSRGTLPLVELFGQRRKIQKHAELVARGEDVWSTSLGPVVRNRIAAHFVRAVRDLGDRYLDGRVTTEAASLLASSEGIVLSVHDLDGYLNALDRADDEAYLSGIEALLLAVIVKGDDHGVRRILKPLRESLNAVLTSERIAFELVNWKFVPFSNRELHEEVVRPALQLLPGLGATWAGVEAAYRSALEEIAADPGDAITDAGTALQETLIALGCKGNALGQLLRDARSRGLLARHDSTLSEGVEKIVQWISADRSELGDSHKAQAGATPDDAWFAVHVVGALIVWLAVGGRGSLTDS